MPWSWVWIPAPQWAWPWCQLCALWPRVSPGVQHRWIAGVQMYLFLCPQGSCIFIYSGRSDGHNMVGSLFWLPMCHPEVLSHSDPLAFAFLSPNFQNLLFITWVPNLPSNLLWNGLYSFMLWDTLWLFFNLKVNTPQFWNFSVYYSQVMSLLRGSLCPRVALVRCWNSSWVSPCLASSPHCHPFVTRSSF